MGFGSDKTGFYKPSAVTVTASGNPLTLQNAKRLRKLTICGNAVQDGTPSPDAPVEVQLCGDRTGNLLSMRNVSASNIPVKSYNNGIIEVIGNSNYSGGRTTRLSEYITLEANQTYTLALYLVSGKVDSSINACLSRRENGNFYNGAPFSVAKRVITITPNENVEVYLGLNLSQRDYNSTLRVAIYKGSYTADTLPAYEPYGYKVSGRAEGLNLLDVSGSTSILNGDTVVDGDTITFTTTDNCYGIKFATLTLEPNTEYTLSYQSVNFDGNYTDSYGLRAVIDNSGVPGGASSYITFTTNETGDVTLSYYVGIPYEGEAGKILTIKGVALYKGSYTAETMPPYEPYQPPQDFAVYLPEQIAKVGDVADEVVVDMEKQTAELKKNVGSMTMSDSYSGATSITDELVRFYHSTTPQRRTSPSTNIIDVMSDIYEADTWNNLGTGSTDKQFVIAGNVNTQVVNVRVPKSVIGGETNELMNTWAANHPATVYYVLDTPVTTDITSLQQWDAMPQVSGTVTLTLSAEVDPSGTEAVYTATKRPKAQAALIEENTIPEEPAETQVSDTDINTEIIMMED